MRRRSFVKGLGLAAGGGALAGLYTSLVEPHWLEVTRPDLPVASLPEGLDGATLAHLSDLHIGPQVSDAFIRETFFAVRALRPDFVVYTGDWITYRGPDQLEQLRRALDTAPTGRLGTIGILGNHDYGFGWRMPEVAEQVVAIAERAGVTMLRNAAASAGGLQFLGFDDLWGPAFGPEALMAGRTSDAPTITLCHNPDALDRDVWSGYRGWVLAGHTHGGQCKPPFLPAPLLPVVNRRYSSGSIALDDGRHVYISRGVGHLLKVRFNVRPEVALFTLRRPT